MTATVVAERHTGRRARRRLILEPVRPCPCCGTEPGERCPDNCIEKDRQR